MSEPPKWPEPPAQGPFSPFLRALLTNDEARLLLGDPIWELNPPQREECGNDAIYALELKAYAQRLLVYEVMSS